MTDTNIKNLPETGNYFTELGYSQSYPWIEVKRTAKTVTLAKVNVKADPEWKEKMDWYAGGFAGHLANQGEQTWLFDGIDHKHTKIVRATKRGWTHGQTRFIEGRANEFYDYNF